MPRGGDKSSFHVVLLAGGSGTRFWPLSRAGRPKQFLALAGRRSLLARTRTRVRALAPPTRTWVVAPEALAGDVRREVPDLRPANLILEPSPRDTAPAIALACETIYRKDPDAVIGVFPTDHLIDDGQAFVASVGVASKAAASGALVCLGIRPDRPETGFGYLRCASTPLKNRAIAVARFVEKPEPAQARRFVRSGRYLWNAGMFVWTARRFLEALEITAPRVLSAVRAHVDGRDGAWNRATRVSVDYAVMEQASHVEVVPLDAGWDDIGSWDAAARHREKDRQALRDAILIDSPGAVSFGDRRPVAIVDLPDVVVVDTEEALLVVSRKSSDKVKQVVAELKRRGREDLL